MSSTPATSATITSSSTNPKGSHISQKTSFSKPRPHPIHHQIATPIYQQVTVSHPHKAFSKSASSLEFEFIPYILIPMLSLQFRISRLNKDIEIIKSIFSHEKTLHHFSFKLECLGPSNLNFLSSLFKNGPPLTTLNFDLSRLHVVSTSSLHPLCLAFKTLKHLSHLTLSFSQASHLDYSLLCSLKTLKGLSSLSLKLSAPKNPNPSSFRKWPKYLSQIPHLSDLSLALMECGSLIDQDLAVLFCSFNKFTQINSIKISFYGAQNCTAQGLYHFFNNIKDLKKLSKISLDIFAFDLCSHPETFAAGFKLLDPQLLCYLSLDISDIGFTDEGLIAFCAVLEGFQSLKTLYLSLAHNSRISHQSLSKLALSLGKLHSLTSLELDLADLENNDECSQETMGLISSGLAALKKLVYLRIDFTNLTQTRDEDLQELALSLKNFPLLEKLSLVFNSCRNLTDNGIKSLAESLKNLHNLKVLSLDFSYVKLMKNESLASLACGIEGLSFLKDLELSFLFCQGIDYQGLIALAEGFEPLRELYNVNLSFPRSVTARGNIEGLERIFEVFRKLDSLKIITVGVESMFLSDELSDKFEIPSKEVDLCIL